MVLWWRMLLIHGRRLNELKGRKLLLRGRNLPCKVKRDLLLWRRNQVVLGREALPRWQYVVWGRKVMRWR